MYKCPFCVTHPFDSDIKLRKHLKKEHPNRKTLIKTTLRPENEEPLQKSNIFSLLSDKENQMLGIRVEGAKDANGAPIIVIAENPLVTSPEKSDTSQAPTLPHTTPDSSPRKAETKTPPPTSPLPPLIGSIPASSPLPALIGSIPDTSPLPKIVEARSLRGRPLTAKSQALQQLLSSLDDSEDEDDPIG